MSFLRKLKVKIRGPELSATSLPVCPPQDSPKHGGRSTLASPEKDKNLDLWDEAYSTLARNPDLSGLLRDYEAIILQDAAGGADKVSALELQAYYDAELSSKREQMERVLARKSQALQDSRLKVKFAPGKEIEVGKYFDKAIGGVLWAKDFVSSAVSAEPHAALAWAGLLLNPAQQRDAAIEAVATIADIVRRSKVIDSVYRDTSASEADLRALKKEFEAKRVKLYASILEVEAQLICQFSQRKIMRWAKDVIMLRPWPTMVADIKKLEALSDDDRKVLDSEKLNAGFARLDSGLEVILRQMKISGAENKKAHEQQQSWRETDEQRINEAETGRILAWISGVPFEEHHKYNCKKRLPGTGAWLFDVVRQPIFNKWLAEGKAAKVSVHADAGSDSASSIMWLLGGIGVGKTTLMSNVIEKILSLPKSDSVCAYFYCERGGLERSAPIDIFRCITRQLAFDPITHCVRAPVLREYELRKKKQFAAGKFSIEECVNLILEMIPTMPPTTIIIDAIDECDSDQRWQLLESVATISSTCTENFKMLLSSRTDEGLDNSIEGAMNLYLDIADNKRDIENFIDDGVIKVSRSRLRTLLRGNVSDDLKKAISDTLKDQAQGMFRWVELQFELICDSERVKREKDVYDLLGKLPKTLAASYDKILLKIESLTPGSRRITKHALSWILCAKRQMAIPELLAAACMDLDGNIDRIDEQDLLQYCCSLIRADHESNCFRPAHPSVRDYLAEHAEFNAKVIQHLAVERCLTEFLTNDKEHSISSEERLPFQNYATTFLSHHLEDIWPHESENLPQSPRFQKFFSLRPESTPSAAFCFWIQMIKQYHQYIRYSNYPLLTFVEGGHDDEDDDDDKTSSHSPLGTKSLIYAASHFGFLSILKSLVDTNDGAPRRNLLDELPIQLALRRGNVRSAELLLAQPIPISAAETEKLLDINHPFLNKAWTSHDIKMKKWVEKEAEACQWSEEEQVIYRPQRLLLSYALGPAVKSGDTNLVAWLLEQGAPENAFHGKPYEGSVLHAAVEAQNEEMVKVLLGAGADPMFPALDWSYRNPVDAAIAHGYESILRCLLNRQSEAVVDQALLHAAHHRTMLGTMDDASEKSVSAISWIMELSPSQNGLNQALFVAVASNSQPVTELLLECGAQLSPQPVTKYGKLPREFDTEDISAETPLQIAIQGDMRDMVVYLLDNPFQRARIEESVTSKDGEEVSLLELAISTHSRNVLKLLLERGAPIVPTLMDKAVLVNGTNGEIHEDNENAFFLQELTERYPDIKERLSKDNSFADSLLHKVLDHRTYESTFTDRYVAGSPSVIRMLLEIGFSNREIEASFLRIAFQKCSVATCVLLLVHGAEVYDASAKYLHAVAKRPEVCEEHRGLRWKEYGWGHRRICAMADLALLLLERGLDPWEPSSNGIPLQIAMRILSEGPKENDSNFPAKVTVFKAWTGNLTAYLDFSSDVTSGRMYYNDHLSQTTIWANPWTGYPSTWLQAWTAAGCVIMLDVEHMGVIWRQSQTQHGSASINEEWNEGTHEKVYYFLVGDGDEQQKIIIGESRVVPFEFPGEGYREYLPGFYHGGVTVEDESTMAV
ncbi:hypothetical protein BP6252_05591 [Coleophoma cylindrospora]|uniref:Uncharacterized protein n=1 Tax=Coleophoma cylindrospora TaxID=1849047 RepID=A0A3D8RUA2_9HELO|nr:hypothetical protein BP6252_05591 [Coleophoma cylindrospora]